MIWCDFLQSDTRSLGSTTPTCWWSMGILPCETSMSFHVGQHGHILQFIVAAALRYVCFMLQQVPHYIRISKCRCSFTSFALYITEHPWFTSIFGFGIVLLDMIYCTYRSAILKLVYLIYILHTLLFINTCVVRTPCVHDKCNKFHVKNSNLNIPISPLS